MNYAATLVRSGGGSPGSRRQAARRALRRNFGGVAAGRGKLFESTPKRLRLGVGDVLIKNGGHHDLGTIADIADDACSIATIAVNLRVPSNAREAARTTA